MGPILRLALFRLPDFRRLAASILGSSVGMMGETVVLGWLTLELTNSPFLVGVAMGMRALPLFFVGVPAGALADRFPRHRLLMVTGAGQALTASTLGVLTLVGVVSLTHVLLLTLAAGTLRGLEHAARQGYTHDVVGGAALVPGMAVLGVAMRAGWLVGSLGVGAIIARYGSGAAYLAVATGLHAARGRGVLRRRRRRVRREPDRPRAGAARRRLRGRRRRARRRQRDGGARRPARAEPAPAQRARAPPRPCGRRLGGRHRARAARPAADRRAGLALRGQRRFRHERPRPRRAGRRHRAAVPARAQALTSKPRCPRPPPCPRRSRSCCTPCSTRWSAWCGCSATCIRPSPSGSPRSWRRRRPPSPRR